MILGGIVSRLSERARSAPLKSGSCSPRQTPDVYGGIAETGKVLAEADAARGSGEIGAVLRKHALYSSHLTKWQVKKREAGILPGSRTAKAGAEVQSRLR